MSHHENEGAFDELVRNTRLVLLGLIEKHFFSLYFLAVMWLVVTPIVIAFIISTNTTELKNTEDRKREIDTVQELSNSPNEFTLTSTKTN